MRLAQCRRAAAVGTPTTPRTTLGLVPVSSSSSSPPRFCLGLWHLASPFLPSFPSLLSKLQGPRKIEHLAGLKSSSGNAAAQGEQPDGVQRRIHANKAARRRLPLLRLLLRRRALEQQWRAPFGFREDGGSIDPCR